MIWHMNVFQDTVSEHIFAQIGSGPGPAPWARPMGRAHIGFGQGPYMGLAHMGMIFMTLIYMIF